MSTDKVLVYAASFLSACAVMACAIWGGGFGFWPHDSWTYTNSEMHEFEHSGRWLAPMLHYLTHNIPQYFAWWASIFLFWWFCYTIALDYLSDLQANNKHLLAFVFSSSALLIPSFYAQLSWPVHSLSAITILVVAELLVKKNPRVVVVVATVIVFAVHQAFAFLTLFFLIPRYSEILKVMRKESMVITAKAVTIWMGAFLLAYLTSKVIQYSYYGKWMEFERWRSRTEISSFRSVLDSFSINFTNFSNHFHDVFSLQSMAYLVLALFLLRTYLRESSRIEVNSFDSLLVIGAVVPLFGYLVTSLSGIDFPVRTTFIFGLSVLCIVLAVYVATRSIVFVVLFTSLFLHHSLTTSYRNVKWYSDVTSDVVGVIHEIEEDSDSLRGVVIYDTNITKGIVSQIIESNDIFLSEPKIFLDIIFNNRVDALFSELGYREVIWCISSSDFEIPECSQIRAENAFSRCSISNPNVCSLGVTNDKYWLITSR